MIRIVSKRDGFRRAGVAHPDRPVVYPDGYFTEKQLEALLSEPLLVVDISPEPEELEVLRAESGEPLPVIQGDLAEGGEPVKTEAEAAASKSKKEKK